MAATLQHLPSSRFDDFVSVMVDAFYDYPVMRYVVGPDGNYDERLRQLVEFFVYRRMRHGAPLLGMVDGGEIVGAATLTLPIEPEPPADVAARRDATWRDLGDATRLRYETYANTTKAFAVAEPHHHLNMIGVRHSHMGHGLARPLLEAVATLAEDDPGSHGVSLTTELVRNLSLYQYFGYEIVGHARVSPELESWGLFSPIRSRRSASRES